MTYNENNDNGELIKWLAILTMSAILTWILVGIAGCTKTVYVPQPEYHTIHDTIKQVTVRDSIVEHYIYEKDSSSFHQSGDTVRIEKWHWYRDYKYEKLLQAQIDSLSHLERDTVTVVVPHEVVKVVPAELKWWQKTLIWWGVITLVLAILYIVLKTH